MATKIGSIHLIQNPKIGAIYIIQNAKLIGNAENPKNPVSLISIIVDILMGEGVKCSRYL